MALQQIAASLMSLSTRFPVFEVSQFEALGYVQAIHMLRDVAWIHKEIWSGCSPTALRKLCMEMMKNVDSSDIVEVYASEVCQSAAVVLEELALIDVFDAKSMEHHLNEVAIELNQIARHCSALKTVQELL